MTEKYDGSVSAIRQRVADALNERYTPDRPFPQWQQATTCEMDRKQLVLHYDALSQRAAEMVAAVAKYGRHVDRCPLSADIMRNDGDTCTCGYE